MKKQNKPSALTQTADSFFSTKTRPFIILSIFIFLFYARTLSYEYIGLDDTTLIESNFPFIKKISNLPLAFEKHVMYTEGVLDKEKDYYRPMLTLSFMLDAQISGSSKPKWYHFSNILYHILACLLLYNFLSKLKVKPLAAFILTLLFSVHPVVDQAVAWVPGRNDTLLAIFVLTCFIYLFRYLESKQSKYLNWHLFFFACALFTKENGVMLLILCPAYLYFFYRNDIKLYWKQFCIAYAALTLLWFFMRAQAIAGSITDNSVQATCSNFLNNVPFLIQYLGKAILPINLSVMCMIEDTNYLQALLALFLLVFALYFSKQKRWGFILFGLGWFILFLSPSFSARLVEGLEHRLYLPIMGFIIIGAETDGMKSLTVENKQQWIVPIIFLLGFLWISNTRLEIFKNRFQFNLSAMETSQYAVVPCVNLAGDYDIAGKKEEAIAMYRTAIQRDSVYAIIHPRNHVSYNSLLHDNLGVLYLGRQQYALAEPQFALASKQGDVYGMYHLANVYYKTNKKGAAAELWKKVIQLQPKEPDFKDAYLHLAQYAKDKGDTTSFTSYVKAYKKLFY